MYDRHSKFVCAVKDSSVTFSSAVFLVLSAALMLACSRPQGGTIATKEVAEETPPPTTEEPANAYFAKLQGNWSRACEDVTTMGDAHIRGMRLVVKVSDQLMTKSLLFYRESTCATLISKMHFIYSDVTIGAEGPEGRGYQVNLALQDYFVTPLSVGVAIDYNSRGVCGLYSGWFVYGPRGVTSLECEPLLGLNLIGRLQGSQHHDVLWVNETATPPIAYFGDASTGNGASPGTRPTAFSAAGLSKE